MYNEVASSIIFFSRRHSPIPMPAFPNRPQASTILIKSILFFTTSEFKIYVVPTKSSSRMPAPALDSPDNDSKAAVNRFSSSSSKLLNLVSPLISTFFKNASTHSTLPMSGMYGSVEKRIKSRIFPSPSFKPFLAEMTRAFIASSRIILFIPLSIPILSPNAPATASPARSMLPFSSSDKHLATR